MEVYVYKCKTCGMKHQVPAYWSSFVKAPTTQFPHMQIKTGSMCETTELDFECEVDNDQI